MVDLRGRGWLVAVIAVLCGCGRGEARTPTPPSGRVNVPAGAFTMGIDERELDGVYQLCARFAKACKREPLIAHHRNETPARRIPVNAFAIDRVEVTNASYRRCVAAGACVAPRLASCLVASGRRPLNAEQRSRVRQQDNYPVVCISPGEARAYCRWAGGSLPTEAQWEKAARGTDRRRFPWGNKWDPVRANWSDDGRIDRYTTTAPVGSYPSGASPSGALDMAGNVWEWVEPPTSAEALMRGGGYAAMPLAMRTTKRVPRKRAGYENIGFRCVYPGTR